MTDNNHPITPPPDLIEDWIEIAKPLPQRPPNPGELAALAARWGADQELEACCEWLRSSLPGYDKHYADYLHTARRPKPPGLKEQALAELAEWENVMDIAPDSPIRRALDQLPDNA